MMTQKEMHPYKQLRADIESCKKCPLWEGRTNAVVGRGRRSSKFVIIGEAPGFEEDKQGRAFVGRAGQKLDDLLMRSGFDPGEILFTNILRCRPEGNIFPSDPEIPRKCITFLIRQLEIVKPRFVLLVGKNACRWFLLDGKPMGTMRTVMGPSYGHTNFPYIEQIYVTYHPAFLLRANDDSIDNGVISTLKTVHDSMIRSGNRTPDVVIGPKPVQQSLF